MAEATLTASAESSDHRVSVRLSPQAKEAVDEIIRLGKFSTIQEAMRRAISDELFLQKQRADGWTMLMKKGDAYKELVWPS